MNRQREDSTGTRRDTNSGARGRRTKKLSLYAPGNEALIRRSGKLQGSFCNADVIEIYSFLGVFFLSFGVMETAGFTPGRSHDEL